jgi:hypothetical protein
MNLLLADTLSDFVPIGFGSVSFEDKYVKFLAERMGLAMPPLNVSTPAEIKTYNDML